ncbi:TatD family hydrolase [Marinobacter sp. VGCF2001]|uniref:TatD family hydrolase n=1 Tax=Marinobacter sp. VGCF2001 TaxID=3417189 RepID=UPI003CEA1469
MQLVDAHCHFDFPVFDGRRESILAQAAKQGVRALVVPGVRRADWSRVAALGHPECGIWYCLGIHPWFVEEHSPDDLAALKEALSLQPEACLAVGECGLDALKGDISAQEPWFRDQIDIARDLRLPLVIHSVKAHDQVHRALNQACWSSEALVHGFSGSYQQARKLIDLGCFIGVGGVITHQRARKTRETIARLPLEALVLETDAPDMPPAGIARGQNSPTCLPVIFDALVQLRREPPEALAAALLANVARLYRTDAEKLCAGP